MTERKWNTVTNPAPMLKFLRGKATERKLILFVCACAARAKEVTNEPEGYETYEIAERYAEGVITLQELKKAWDDYFTLYELPFPFVVEHAISAATNLAQEEVEGGRSGHIHDELLRDIFGNPFRPLAFDPDWRTSTVLALADGIYADRAFDRLPILADALMDAGCDAADILAHCRGDGPHVRGCWVVDLILGKE